MDKKYVLSAVAGGERTTSAHWRAGLPCRSVEADAARLKEYTEQYPGIKGYADMDEAIACGYDGVYGCASCGTSLSGRQETAGKRAER